MVLNKIRNSGTHRLGLLALAVIVLAAPWTSAPLHAGAYIFAGESNGTQLILHPQGYTGLQTSLTVEVCIDPTSPLPFNATALTDVEKSVINNVAIWNQLQPTVGNVLRGSANNVGSTEVDFEGVALHEIGHCIGLAHVNLASESGLTGADTNYTKSTDGVLDLIPQNTPDFNLNAGADGVRGTLDDLRGDDNNLHWFRVDSNDPGQLPLPVPVDNTTYDHDQALLPAGHLHAQNLDRDAAVVMGHPSTFPINTEAVMQQGTFSDEDQRRLTADGVGTLLLAMSGLDQTAGTADDYVIDLVYGGISNAASCDLTMRFEPSASVGLAFCQITSAFFIASPPGTTHVRIGGAFMRFGQEFNWFFNQTGACRQTLDLVTGQWKQMALSCSPPAGADTVADLLGDDLSGTYDVDWVVFERDAANDSYDKLQLTEPLLVGRGYWIKTNQASQTINIEEDFNDEGDWALEADAAGRFNMVGHRYWYDEAWADVQVIDGASVLTLAQADPAGACQGPNPVTNGCIMSRIAHKWNGAAYEAFDGQTPGLEGTLENFDGFWVKAYKSGISLRIPDQRSTPSAPHDEVLPPSPAGAVVGLAPDDLDSGELVASFAEPVISPVAAAVAAPTGWYVRLIAESGDFRDAGNVLGQLSDSVKGYDSHDLVELAPFSDNYLSIVFPHEDWRDRSGDYTSDYHGLGKTYWRDSWRFDVLTAEPATEVTLKWEGAGEQIERAVLVNHVTRERVDVQPGGSYTFITNGERHPFSWHVRSARTKPKRGRRSR